MTISLADAFARIQTGPHAPVILIDTCCFLDLFRTDDSQAKVPYQPRAPHEEIQDAADLLALVNAAPGAAHLIVPELVPREYSDHAAAIQAQFGKWTELHDRNQDWLQKAGQSVALALPAPHPVHPYDLAAMLRSLADNLLAKAQVLERDPACVDRALHRLINKIRPSHRKEVKDSINLEQCLELSRRLQAAGFARSRVWVSSNTSDFAQPGSSHVHADLRGDFAAAGLKYFTSLWAALGRLRADGEI
jgi:hypothetical protein